MSNDKETRVSIIKKILFLTIALLLSVFLIGTLAKEFIKVIYKPNIKVGDCIIANWNLEFEQTKNKATIRQIKEIGKESYLVQYYEGSSEFYMVEDHYTIEKYYTKIDCPKKN